jgi:hypothetical protein
MPNGPRIRANNVYGVISDNPLTAASGTYNSVSLPLLPVVSAAHAVVVFDPKRVYGDPEIVVVTAHTVASTVATILRGQYGTSAREHPQGTAWAHVPVDEDWTEILTSSTRPIDPYRGQAIFETDTNRYVGRSTADVWQQMGLFFDPPACRVFNNANISVVNATPTDLTYNSELFDTDSMHDTAVNPTRITIRTPGIYLVQAGGTWQADNDYVRRLISFVVNATTTIARQSYEGSFNVTANEGFTLSTVYKFAANDFITASVFQQNTNAGTNSIGDVGFMSPWFAATWIGRGN